jgi:acetyl esterase
VSGRALDPVIQKALERMRAGLERPFDPARVVLFREPFSESQKDRTVAPGVTVTDVDIDGVPVRLYRPDARGALPLHVFYHGGGFILGSALSGEGDGMLSRRAAAAQCVVASVEYALAPEHPFPQGIEESYRALVGLVARAVEFKFDTRAVSIGGVSSGGNFAAAVALMARDRGGPKLMLQLIEIAGVDLTKSSWAWRHPIPEHDTTRERELAMVELYIPDKTQFGDVRASPLYARDLSNLPPAYFMNAEFDPRRDECESYVARLNDSGGDAVARTMAGHIHGSMGYMGWEPAERWQAEANDVLAAANKAAVAGSVFKLPR